MIWLTSSPENDLFVLHVSRGVFAASNDKYLHTEQTAVIVIVASLGLVSPGAVNDGDTMFA